MLDFSLLPRVDEAYVAYWDTVRKSAEDSDTQARFQKNPKHPTFLEQLRFEKAPLSLHSLVVLENGESVELSEGDSTVVLVSETVLKSQPLDFGVFAREILDNGATEWKRLSLVSNYGNTLVFLDRHSLESSRPLLVDRILLVGSFESLSYMVMAFDSTHLKLPTRRVNRNTVYYGKDILDLSKHIIAPESLNDAIGEAEEAGPSLEAMLSESRSSGSRTLSDLTHYLTLNEEYEKIQKLKKSLDHLVEDVNSQKHVEEAVLVLSKFICNDLLFTEFLDYGTLETLMKLVSETVAYENESHYFKLLKLLTHDGRLARHLLNSLGFGKSLELLFSDTSSMDQKNCLLNLLLIVLSDPLSLGKFLSNEGPDKAFSYDYFVSHVSDAPLFSALFGNWLQDIGNNIAVYIALSQADSLCSKLKKDKLELGNQLTENIHRLSHSVNHAIDTLRPLELENQQLLSNKNKFVRHFLVTCLRDTEFPKVIHSLFTMVYYQLSHFPVLSMDLHRLVEKPLSFIKRYMEYLHFHDSLLLMSKIAALVLKLGAPRHQNLRRGFPYTLRPVADYFRHVRRECSDLLLYCRVLSLLSTAVSQGSFDTTFDKLHLLSNKFEGFYRVMARLMEKLPVSAFILHSLKSYVKLIRDNAQFSLANVDRKVSFLLNLLCRAIKQDPTHNLTLDVGRSLLEFLDLYLTKLSEATCSLDLDLARSTHSVLQSVFGHVTKPADPLGKESVEDVGQFLASVFRSVGLEFVRTVGGELGESPNHNGSDPRKGAGEAKSDEPPKRKSSEFVDVETVSSTYSNLLDFTFPYLKRTNPRTLQRARELGVEPENYRRYSDSGLSVVPPEILPGQADCALTLAVGLAQRADSGPLFRSFMQKGGHAPLLDLWLYALSSTAPDLKSVLNAGVNAFGSLTGYSWLNNADFYLPLLSKVMYLMYMALRHLSLDAVTASFVSMSSDNGAYDLGEVEEADLYYVDDELLNCLVLTSTQVFSVKSTAASDNRTFLRALEALMHYWYRRFKRSRAYLLNYLMEVCASLPRMYEGVAFLMAACKPLSDLRTKIAYRPSALEKQPKKRDSLKEDRDLEPEDPEEKPEADGSEILYNRKTFNLSNTSYKIVLERGRGQDLNTLSRLLLHYVTVDRPVLVELLCVLASRASSVDPAALVTSSTLAYLCVLNSLPVLDFLNMAFDVEHEDAKSSLRFLAFLSNLIRLYNLDTCKLVESIFGLNHLLLKSFNRLSSLGDLLSAGYPVMFEALVNSFACHNKLWARDPDHLMRLSNFDEYVSLLASAVAWLLNSLNSFKFDLLGDGTPDSLPSDLLLLGLFALWTAFQQPFTTLTVLYSLDKLSSLGEKLGGQGAKFGRPESRGSESSSQRNEGRSSDRRDRGESGLEARANDSLHVNNLVDQLRECASDPSNLSEPALLNLLSSFYLLSNVYTAVLHTGKSQDIFVFHMALNMPLEQLSDMKKPPELFDTTFLALETLLAHLKSREDLRHMVALLLLVKGNFESLKKRMVESPELKKLKSVPPRSLFTEPLSEEGLFFYVSDTGTPLTTTFLETLNSYRTWGSWRSLASFESFEVDCISDEAFRPFSGHRSLHRVLAPQKPDIDVDDLKIEVKLEGPLVVKSSLTSEHWKEFDAQLSAAGVDLLSLVNNPAVLLEAKNRATFLDVLVRNRRLFSHVLKLGVNVLD